MYVCIININNAYCFLPLPLRFLSVLADFRGRINSEPPEFADERAFGDELECPSIHPS